MVNATTLLVFLVTSVLLSFAALAYLIWRFFRTRGQSEADSPSTRPIRGRLLWSSLSILLLVPLLAVVGIAIGISRDGGSRRPSQQKYMASIQLGDKNEERGIELREHRDGQTVPDNVGGLDCRSLAHTPESPSKHFYFALDDTFKSGKPFDALVVVEYFDSGPGNLQVQYDAIGNAYASAAPTSEPRNGSQVWRRACFLCRNAGFGNLQNGGSDFRVVGSALSIRRVTILRLDAMMAEHDL